MRLICLDELRALLRPYEGHVSFVHAEVTPGAFVRNVPVSIVQTYAVGNGPYRVALRLREDGWIRVEGLTHLMVEETGRLLLAGHDERGRLTSALELSWERFPA